MFSLEGWRLPESWKFFVEVQEEIIKNEFPEEHFELNNGIFFFTFANNCPAACEFLRFQQFLAKKLQKMPLKPPLRQKPYLTILGC
jgi:hypothetical protein